MDSTGSDTTIDPDRVVEEPLSPAVSTAGSDDNTSADGPLRITDAALAQVLEILAGEDDPGSLGLRIEITGVRGVEYAYDLAFEERSAAEPDDRVYRQGDLTVMVEASSVDKLWGATLDLPSAAGQGGLVIRNPNRPDPLADTELNLTGSVEDRVHQLINEQINPALASHGGFASLVKIEGDTAHVLMGGGCQGCAVSSLTLREGIRKSIVTHVPEITEVIDATDHDAGENPYYS